MVTFGEVWISVLLIRNTAGIGRRARAAVQMCTEYASTATTHSIPDLLLDSDRRDWPQAKLAWTCHGRSAVFFSWRLSEYAGSTGPRPCGRAGLVTHDGRGPAEPAYREVRLSISKATVNATQEASLACGQSGYIYKLPLGSMGARRPPGRVETEGPSEFKESW